MGPGPTFGGPRISLDVLGGNNGPMQSVLDQ